MNESKKILLKLRIPQNPIHHHVNISSPGKIEVLVKSVIQQME